MPALDDGTFTISNITVTRTLAPADGLQGIADVLATMIYEVRTGLYNGSNYTITGFTTRFSYDCDDATGNHLAGILQQLVTTNTGTAFSTVLFSVSDATYDYVFDPTSTTGNEVSQVLAAFLREGYGFYASVVTGERADVATMTGERADVATMTGERADVALVTGGRR